MVAMIEKDVVSNTIDIPKAIHRAAKIAAVTEGVTLQAWIIEAMRLRAESLAKKEGKSKVP